MSVVKAKAELLLRPITERRRQHNQNLEQMHVISIRAKTHANKSLKLHAASLFNQSQNVANKTKAYAALPSTLN